MENFKTEEVGDWCNGVPAYKIKIIGDPANTAVLLYLQGYRVISRKFRIASRVDRKYDTKGGRLDDDYARRCYSKDLIHLPESVRKCLTNLQNRG